MTGAASPTIVLTPPAVEEQALAAAIEAVGADGTVKRDFLALPFGNPFFGRDGRGPYVLTDRAHAERVIAATKTHLGSCEMMANYDHQPELAAVAGVGGRAPASGWVKGLSVGDAGIHVSVEWTKAAEQALAAREYRYVSPNFRVTKDGGVVTRLVNIALTNSPNLELPALAAQEPSSPAKEKPPMTTIALATLIAPLALAATATEAEVLAAIGALKSKAETADTVLASTRKTLGLADDAATDVVLAAVATAKAAGAPDPAKFVPKEGYDALAARLQTIEEKDILASVDQAVKDGKVAPAMKDWAIELGKKHPDQLQSFLEKAVPFAGDKPVIAGPPKAKVTQLTQDQLNACEMTGTTHEDFLKALNEETV